MQNSSLKQPSNISSSPYGYSHSLNVSTILPKVKQEYIFNKEHWKTVAWLLVSTCLPDHYSQQTAFVLLWHPVCFFCWNKSGGNIKIPGSCKGFFLYSFVSLFSFSNKTWSCSLETVATNKNFISWKVFINFPTSETEPQIDIQLHFKGLLGVVQHPLL